MGVAGPAIEGGHRDILAFKVGGVVLCGCHLFKGGEIDGGCVVGGVDGGLHEVEPLGDSFWRVGVKADELDAVFDECGSWGEEDGAEDELLSLEPE